MDVDWDWRTAGKTRDGEGYREKNYTQGDGHHRAIYKSIKGILVPVYGQRVDTPRAQTAGELPDWLVIPLTATILALAVFLFFPVG